MSTFKNLKALVKPKRKAYPKTVEDAANIRFPDASLQGLPAEIRTMIYDLVLKSPTGIVRIRPRKEGSKKFTVRTLEKNDRTKGYTHKEYTEGPVISLGLLSISKQIGQEASAYFWSNNMIDVDYLLERTSHRFHSYAIPRGIIAKAKSVRMSFVFYNTPGSSSKISSRQILPQNHDLSKLHGWPALTEVTIVAIGRSDYDDGWSVLGCDEFLTHRALRTLLKDRERADSRFRRSLRLLAESFQGSGALSHLKRQILIAPATRFSGTQLNPIMGDPTDILLDVSRAIDGDVLIDDRTICAKGKLVRPVFLQALMQAELWNGVTYMSIDEFYQWCTYQIFFENWLEADEPPEHEMEKGSVEPTYDQRWPLVLENCWSKERVKLKISDKIPKESIMELRGNMRFLEKYYESAWKMDFTTCTDVLKRYGKIPRGAGYPSRINKIGGHGDGEPIWQLNF